MRLEILASVTPDMHFCVRIVNDANSAVVGSRRAGESSIDTYGYVTECELTWIRRFPCSKAMVPMIERETTSFCSEDWMDSFSWEDAPNIEALRYDCLNHRQRPTRLIQFTRTYSSKFTTIPKAHIRDRGPSSMAFLR
jgi:hypothetical protein